MTERAEAAAFRHRLDRIYLRYTVGFVLFVGLIALLERLGKIGRAHV